MICFAFQLPPGAPRGPVVMVLILQMDNLSRMQAADPFDLKLRTLPLRRELLDRRLLDVDLVIASEDDTATLMGFRQRDDIAGLMNWLERGRQIRPGDLGSVRVIDPAKKERPS